MDQACGPGVIQLLMDLHPSYSPLPAQGGEIGVLGVAPEGLQDLQEQQDLFIETLFQKAPLICFQVLLHVGKNLLIHSCSELVQEKRIQIRVLFRCDPVMFRDRQLRSSGGTALGIFGDVPDVALPLGIYGKLECMLTDIVTACASGDIQAAPVDLQQRVRPDLSADDPRILQLQDLRAVAQRLFFIKLLTV